MTNRSAQDLSKGFELVVAGSSIPLQDLDWFRHMKAIRCKQTLEADSLCSDETATSFSKLPAIDLVPPGSRKSEVMN